MRLSVLVLTCRRLDELLACVDALARDGAREKCELVVGLNDDAEGNEAARSALRERHPWARTVALNRADRATARNLMAAQATGDAFYFLDDDTIPPPGFLDRALAAFARWPQAYAVGGPNVGPPGAEPLPRAIDYLLRSYLGAGPMAVRHRRDGPEEPSPGWTFTLSNFGVRRSAYEAGLRFPGRAASAEETLFLHELGRLGHAAVHSPGLFVYHRRRRTLKAFLAQTYTCGIGRAQITRAAPGSLLPATLAPAASLAAAAVLAFAAPKGLAVLLGAYAAACVACAVHMAVSERDAAALLLPPLYPLAHAAYAAGMAAGAIAGPACDAAVEPGLSWRVGRTDG